MQINNLLPVLLELLLCGEANRENKSKIAHPSNRQQLSRAQPNPSGPAQHTEQSKPAGRNKTVLENINHSSPGQVTTNKESGDPQSELIFLPLPLKSELFPDARFYKQITDGERSRQGDNEKQNRLVFGLNAPSLGELYFLVVQQENNLSIKCAASKLQTVNVLREGFTGLKEKLHRLGWKKIHCSCIQVKNPGEQPGVTPSGFIDFKI